MYMELQLGLALPSSTPIPIKRFDLNNNFGFEPNDVAGSNAFNKSVLQLVPPFFRRKTCDDAYSHDNKKRSFCDVFEENKTAPSTLPLLLWNNQPNEEDDPRELEDNPSLTNDRNEEADGLEGWPPIKGLRTKKLRYQNYDFRGRADHNNRIRVENGRGCFVAGASNSKYVKVNMEGVGIGRKIDLSLHHSFETLATTLLHMFDINNPNGYKLTYQDTEGDWLLAEQDLPWRTFMASVQRLRLLRNSC